MSEQQDIDIRIYKERDYILISPYTRTRGGFSVVAKDYIYLKVSENYKELGINMCNAVEFIKKCPLDKRTAKEREEDSPWKKVTNYKTKRAFWEKNHVAFFSVEENEVLRIFSTYKGGPMSSGDIFKTIDLESNATPEEIGNAIMDVFQAVEEYYEKNPILKRKKRKTLEFETLSDNKVTYLEPSEDFTDIGDSHAAEVYIAYEYTESPENIIAFMMDSGYEDYTKQAIRKRLEQTNGKIIRYTYKEIEEEYLKFEITAKTEDKMITSSIYRIGEDDYFEVITEIDLANTDEQTQGKLKREFKKIKKSIEIKRAIDKKL